MPKITYFSMKLFEENCFAFKGLKTPPLKKILARTLAVGRGYTL
jgi:hypothetical protein